MKDKIFWILIIGFLLSILYLDHKSQRTWIVKVFFCDSRPPKIVRYQSAFTVDDQDINRGINYPKWNGMLNVCELQVIKEVK
jgi:hypothetical protein